MVLLNKLNKMDTTNETTHYTKLYLKYRFIYSIIMCLSFLLTLILLILSVSYLKTNEDMNHLYVSMLCLTFGNIYCIVQYVNFGHIFHDYLLKKKSTIIDIRNMNNYLNVVLNTLNETFFVRNFFFTICSYIVFLFVNPNTYISSNNILLSYFIVLSTYIIMFMVSLICVAIFINKLYKSFIEEQHVQESSV